MISTAACAPHGERPFCAMTFPARIFHVVALTALLAGCSIYTEAERVHLRQKHLVPRTLFKIERGEPLAPEDILEMHRRGVPAALTIRQLNQEGVDSLFTRADFAALRHGGVSPAVIHVAAAASERFEHEHGRGELVVDEAAYVESPGLHGTLGFGIGATF